MEFGTISNDLVDYLGTPFFTTSFSPLQLIEKMNQKSAHLPDGAMFEFLAPPLNFLFIVMVGFLIYRVLLLLFLRSKRSSGGPFQQTWQIKMLTLANLLFLFFNRKLFEGNLNTSNVLVKTDELLYSEEQVLNTQKEFCFVDESSRVNYLKNVSITCKVLLTQVKRQD